MDRNVRPKISRTEDWTYIVEGHDEELPSVTNIIKATVPKQLAWWGMQVGCDGVAQLMRNGPVTVPPYWTGQQLVSMLNDKKLTVNDVLDKAGKRGTTIHKILEKYGKTGNLPEEIDPTYAGYARGLVRWLMENRPEFISQEVMTASLKHGYAGSFDGRVVMHDGKYKGQTALIDLKTSKAIYKDQHFPQVEAYEQAEVELGERPTDVRLVVQLSSDGKIKMRQSTYTFEDFLVLLNHYKQIQKHKRKKK